MFGRDSVGRDSVGLDSVGREKLPLRDSPNVEFEGVEFEGDVRELLELGGVKGRYAPRLPVSADEFPAARFAELFVSRELFISRFEVVASRFESVPALGFCIVLEGALRAMEDSPPPVRPPAVTALT